MLLERLEKKGNIFVKEKDGSIAKEIKIGETKVTFRKLNVETVEELAERYKPEDANAFYDLESDESELAKKLGYQAIAIEYYYI